MDFLGKERDGGTPGYKINIRIVTITVVLIVVISTLINFIQIYSYKKSSVLKELTAEANSLKTVIADHLNYSKYFIQLIGKTVGRNPNNLNYINDTLQAHFLSQKFNLLFGWRKYSWVNHNFEEVVTSTGGVEAAPRKIDFVEDIANGASFGEKGEENNIVFRMNKPIERAHSLKLINVLFNEKTRQFIGAAILSYDIDTMVKSLNERKKSPSINFVIIDKNLEVVAKSRPEIDNIITKNSNQLVPSLQKALRDQEADTAGGNIELLYLDMLDGVNYFSGSIADLPFAIIVNMDNAFIKNDIFESITKKFLEAAFFAGICLVIIISIYKRETSLRARAERATLLANNATKAKTDFLAFTAHEIRSPLGFILTGSEVMYKELFGHMPQRYIEYAEGIHRNAQIILDFITDMLDENQIIEGKFKIVNSLTKIEEIITRVIKFHSGKKNISIIADFAPGLPLLICDKRRITQVVDNLVSNSIKYSNKNTVITISVEIKEGKMVITVVDQGLGMKESEIPIALSQYGTLNKKEYQKGGSYGLGLPIVKMLLDAHGASLEIQSSEGVGTTVKIVFPKFKIIYNKAL